jgi:hypothetical protein
MVHSTKVSVSHRVGAKLIDLFFVLLVGSIIPYPLGPLLGFVYSLVGDGMPFKNFRGQSVGKKLMNLQAVRQGDQRPIEWKESILRNAPVGVVTFFAIIPIWGWFILAVVGIPLMALEIYLMLRVDTGQRLGDVMGKTEVVSKSS